MNMDLPTTAGTAAGAMAVIGTIYRGWRHISFNIAQKKEKEHQKIISAAKEEMNRIKSELESKINKLEIDLETQKENISKDFMHMKETYNAELRVLSNKIDDLRQDLSDQHAQMVSLLTQLVNSR